MDSDAGGARTVATAVIRNTRARLREIVRAWGAAVLRPYDGSGELLAGGERRGMGGVASKPRDLGSDRGYRVAWDSVKKGGQVGAIQLSFYQGEFSHRLKLREKGFSYG